MTKQKVFGYVNPSKKDRIAKLRESDERLTESRLVDEGLTKILEFYEDQMHKLHPMEPVQRTSARRKR